MPEKIRLQMFQSTNASPWTTSRRNIPAQPPERRRRRRGRHVLTNQSTTPGLQPLLKSSIRLIFPTASLAPCRLPLRASTPVPQRIPFVPPDHLGGYHPGRPPPPSSQ